MAVVKSEYDSSSYIIYLNSKPIYQAGNSPLDSQGYLREGVSLEQMREWCESTPTEIAIEKGAKLGQITNKVIKVPKDFILERE